MPLALGYGWSSVSPGTPNAPGLEYRGRYPDVPITVEEYGSGVVVVPLHARLQRYLERGQLPLWNPEQGLGQPFAAQGEGGPYFPLAIVRSLVPYSLGNYVTVLGIYTAGAAVYGLVRGLGGSPVGGVFGGAAFELSGALSLNLARPNIADQLCMLPVLVWAAEVALRRRTVAGYALLAVIAALHLVAGFIQIAVLGAVVLVAFVLTYAWQLNCGLAARARDTSLALGAFGLGNALAAFYLLPLAEAARVSFNKNTELLGFIPIPTANWVAFVVPTLFGPLFATWVPGKYPDVVDWNNLYAFVGFSVVALVALGWAVGGQAWPARSRLPFRFFSVLGVFLLLRYLGFLPAAAVNLLPVLGRLSPKHANGVTVFCLVVAAALAVDQVRARPGVRIRGWELGLLAMLAASVVALIGQRGGPGVIDRDLARTYVSTTAAVVAGVLLALWIARRWGKLSPGGAGMLLIATVVAELGSYVPLGSSSQPVLAARLALSGLIVGIGVLLAIGYGRSAAALAAVAVVSYALVVALPATGLPRQFDVDQPPPFMRWLASSAGDQYRSFGIAPDFSSLAGVQDISVVGPLAPNEYATFVDLISAPAVSNFFRGSSTFGLTTGDSNTYMLDQYVNARPILDWVGVRYLVLDKAFFHPGARTDDQVLADPTSGVQPVYEDGTARILESPTARPKAEFWDSAQVYPSPGAILDDLKKDPNAILGPPRLEASQAPRLQLQGSSQPGQVTVDSYRPNQVQLSLSAPSAGVVVLKDAYFPGWQASVDGRPTDVLRVNAMVRGVLIPSAGQHRVTFEYQPASFVRGVVLASAVAVLLVVALAVTWRFGTARESCSRSLAVGERPRRTRHSGSSTAVQRTSRG